MNFRLWMELTDLDRGDHLNAKMGIVAFSDNACKKLMAILCRHMFNGFLVSFIFSPKNQSHEKGCVSVF